MTIVFNDKKINLKKKFTALQIAVKEYSNNKNPAPLEEAVRKLYIPYQDFYFSQPEMNLIFEIKSFLEGIKDSISFQEVKFLLNGLWKHYSDLSLRASCSKMLLKNK